MNKDEMYSEINAYLQHVNFAKQCYDAYMCLFKNIEENHDIITKASGFFTITKYALNKCLLIELAKMYCGSKQEKNISKLINIASANFHLFTKGDAKSLCASANSILKSELKDIVQKLKSRRDQDLTHNDPQYFDGLKNPALDNYISPTECSMLIVFAFNFCFELLDCLSIEDRPSLEYGADDLNVLINELKKHINS